MRQNGYSSGDPAGGGNKKPGFNTAVACICIIVYVAAIAIAAVRILLNAGEYRLLARDEFYELSDRAAAAASLGFMSQPYQQALMEALLGSRTLEGVILSGMDGGLYVSYPFERVRGGSIVWRDGHLFRKAFGLSSEILEEPLRIEGYGQFTISAVYSTVNYPFVVDALKYSLIMIGAALALAFITLLGGAVSGRDRRERPSPAPAPKKRTADRRPPERTAPPEAGAGGELYSPRTGASRELYTRDRLGGELRRAASRGEDLSVLVLGFGDSAPDEDGSFLRFAEEAVRFFGGRDFVFERGEAGFSVIIPGLDLDGALEKAGTFLRLAAGFLSPEAGEDLRAGLSSRSERSVDPDRLLFEAVAALERARRESSRAIIAFRIDPEKYRAFMAARQ